MANEMISSRTCVCHGQVLFQLPRTCVVWEFGLCKRSQRAGVSVVSIITCSRYVICTRTRDVPCPLLRLEI